MAQHDYVIDNSTGANVRADINSVLQAIASNNSGSSAPSTTYALQNFANTTDSMLQLRNSANNAFVNLRKFDGSCPLPDGSASSPSLFFDDDTNTGIFSDGADEFNIATGGVERLGITSGAVVFNQTGTNTDFRVEGDTEINLLFVDAGNNKVAVGSSTPSAKFTVTDTTAFTSFASSTPSASQCMLQLFNNPSSEAANHHSTLQFGVFGGTHNRIATISAVSESASNRKLGLVFCTDSGANRNERMRLTGDGSLGLGTSSPSAKLDVAGNQLFSEANPQIQFNAGGPIIRLPSANTLAFLTDSTTERARIDSSGHIIFTGGSSQKVAFGVTDNTKYAGFGRHDGAAQDVGLNFYTTTNAGTTFVNHFRIDHNGDLLGTDTDGISSISDSRVKTDITDYTYDLAKFKQFAPKQFNWKNPEYHGEKTNVKGFLAQDLEAIDTQWVGSSFIEKDHPDYDLVDKSKNGQDEDVGVAKTSKFGGKDAMYISVIHQLIAKIETLETKVAVLEAA